MKPATGQDESAGGPVSPLGEDAQSNDDEPFLAELRRAVATFDAPPTSAAEFGLDVLSWRDPDAELAALVADSRELAGAVRSGNREVLLRFEVAPYAITLEASPDAAGRYRVVGQVEPGVAGQVDIRQSDGAPGERELSVRCDEWGRFEAYPVAGGPVSLRLTPDKGHAVRTTWVVL
jgi:hypothetical protein